jgi:hypothetical protein
MHAAAIILLAAACGSEASGAPKGAISPGSPETADAAAPYPGLRQGLALFYPFDESGDGVRVDRVNGVPLVPWQRTGWGAYTVDATGTSATAAAVGDGQHIQGADGYHFATYTTAALEHHGASFTWAGWISVDAPSGETPYTDDQTWLAKWNGTPDTTAPIDHREYRIFFEHESSRMHFEVSADGLSGPDHSQVVTHPLALERERMYFVQAWHDAQAGMIHLRLGTQANHGEVESAHFDNGVFSGDADLDVGAQNTCTDDHLQGVVDALGFWTRALTEEESRTLWNGGKGLEL